MVKIRIVHVKGNGKENLLCWNGLDDWIYVHKFIESKSGLKTKEREKKINNNSVLDIVP